MSSNNFVKCDDCKQKMTLNNSCTMAYVLIENKRLKRIPYRNKYNIPNCHDCGVAKEQIHHYGCDMERCPICKEQLFICNCKVMGVVETKDSLPEKFQDRKKALFEQLGVKDKNELFDKIIDGQNKELEK